MRAAPSTLAGEAPRGSQLPVGRVLVALRRLHASSSRSRAAVTPLLVALLAGAVVASIFSDRK